MLVAIIGVATIFIQSIDHDVAWHLYAADRMLHGDRLYVDLIEYNLPWIYYLSMPAVLASRVTAMSPQIAFKMFVLLLIALSVSLSIRVTSRALCHNWESRALWYGALLFTTLIAIGGNFGQREHLFVVLALPYVLSVAGRIEGEEMGWVRMSIIGAMAALGMALKPHFLLVGVVLELYLLMARGRRRVTWRPELLVGLMVLVGLGLIMAVSSREYFGVAKLASQTLHAYDRPLLDLARQPRMIASVVGMVASLLIPAFGPSTWVRKVCTIGAAVSVLLVFVQRRGWGYHVYPAISFTGLSLAIALIDAMQYSQVLQRVRSIGVIIALGLVLTLVCARLNFVVRKHDLPISAGYAKLVETVKVHARGGYIMMFSSSMYPGFPLVNDTGASWAARFPFLWPLPGSRPQTWNGQPHPRPEAERKEVERYVVECVVTDLVRRAPTVVIVDESRIKQGFHAPFDYVEFFLADEGFRQVWKVYSPCASIGNYRVYCRNRSAGSR
jgi:hypothetical protein